jgi:hypothetical protein
MLYLWQLRAYHVKLPEQRKETGFLGRNVTVDCNVSELSQIEDTLHIDDIHLRKLNQHQLLVPIGMRNGLLIIHGVERLTPPKYKRIKKRISIVPMTMPQV